MRSPAEPRPRVLDDDAELDEAAWREHGSDLARARRRAKKGDRLHLAALRAAHPGGYVDDPRAELGLFGRRR